MTLTLDDVRNKRFRMARKTGYEVLEVDEFVDEVEESFAQLLEENQNLRKQVEALRQGDPAERTDSGPAEPSPAAEVEPAAAGGTSTTGTTTFVVTTGKEASSAVVRLVELSTAQSEQLVAEASEDASRIRDEASREAQEVTTGARTRAERLESEARVAAERLQAEAQSHADALDRDVASRRQELFADLDQQRDQLTVAIAGLRRFESTFRTNLTDHLRRQIESLEAGHAEPAEVPELVAGTSGDALALEAAPHGDGNGEDEEHDVSGGSTSDTPRLDALLGDQR